MNKINFGMNKSDKKKVENSEAVPTEVNITQSEVSQEPVKQPYYAYSVIKQGKEYNLLVVEIDLTTMKSSVSIKELKVDNEPRAVTEMNRLFFEQSQRVRGVK